MRHPTHILVLDIGKTNAKVALVDAASLAEIDVLTVPNRTLAGPPYPHVDVDGLWRFFLAAARALHARHGVHAIVPTTHGATAALLDADGALALPVLDYEHAGPDETAAAYDAVRPAFAETGSPRLGAGLNCGAQIFWQYHRFPAEAARVRTILTYPQYWAYRLTGVAATEATSLGCHTDLWNPQAGRLSSLPAAMDWPLAPVRRAGDLLGPISAGVARETGLDPTTPVHCGIHDSNASLLPHLLSREAPFAVVSTGTWVIAMAVGARPERLDPARDTLVNVNAFGGPVPSARFMGGREWSLIFSGQAPQPSQFDVERVLSLPVMLLPSVVEGCGPFPKRRHAWTPPQAEIGGGERAAAASFYLAMMTSVCLEMIGAEGPVIVEGPFAANALYLRMLSSCTDRLVSASAAGTGTTAGSALLLLPQTRAEATEPAAPHQAKEAGMPSYYLHWRRTLQSSHR